MTPCSRCQLARALAEAWDRPNYLAPAALALLRLDRDQEALAPSSAPPRCLVGELVDKWLLDSGRDAEADPLLLTLLEAALIPDPATETVLTTLRRALLQRIESAVEEPEITLSLVCALAHHCFLNEYVFIERPEETASADRLRRRLQAILVDSGPLPELTVAIVAAYVPLHRLDGAERLVARAQSPTLQRLVDRQVREPLEEAALKGNLLRLTPIDESSVAVRAQYETNPYPRWFKVADETSSTLHDALRRMFPHAALPATGAAKPDILIAGCGTGQHAIETALRFADCRVLAVDLSLASLPMRSARRVSSASPMSTTPRPTSCGSTKAAEISTSSRRSASCITWLIRSPAGACWRHCCVPVDS